LAALIVSEGHARSDGPLRNRPVDAIIIHSLGGPDCKDGRVFFKTIEGSAADWAAFFAKLPSVSAHYFVGRDGAVVPLMPEDRVAVHASGWNRRSIGIELVNNGDGIDPFPDAQMTALLTLVRDLRRRHPAIRIENVRRHSDIDHSTFPAAKHGAACTSFRRKFDPGHAFPWDRFLRALYSGV
jgi:N-acetyl-anhydromuramyl-L-alanine amidase AmpD